MNLRLGSQALVVTALVAQVVGCASKPHSPVSEARQPSSQNDYQLVPESVRRNLAQRLSTTGMTMQTYGPNLDSAEFRHMKAPLEKSLKDYAATVSGDEFISLTSTLGGGSIMVAGMALTIGHGSTKRAFIPLAGVNVAVSGSLSVRAASVAGDFEETVLKSKDDFDSMTKLVSTQIGLIFELSPSQQEQFRERFVDRILKVRGATVDPLAILREMNVVDNSKIKALKVMVESDEFKNVTARARGAGQADLSRQFDILNDATTLMEDILKEYPKLLSPVAVEAFQHEIRKNRDFERQASALMR